MVTKEIVLEHIASAGSIEDTLSLSNEKGWDHNKVVGIVKSLASLEAVTLEDRKNEVLHATEEGKQYLENGSPEAQVWRQAKEKGSISQADLDEALGPVAKVGFGAAMKLKWVSMDKSKVCTPLVDEITDTIQQDLRTCDGKDPNGAVETLSKQAVDALKKRKMLSLVSVTSYKVKKTSSFTTNIKKLVTDLTADMIANKSWQTQEFKPYNLEALGITLPGGHLHPLLKVRHEIRLILLLMGFEEMPTNNWVENSFWNFDTLFQPQQHPARDAHDTFFIKSPAEALTIPNDYVARVKKMHEEGGHGARGWRYCWSEKEARKNLLRTHTTAVSSRMLYKLGQEYKKTGVFTPKKYFSIDRVFRNETLDATHLAEFHQIEGVVIDKNLTLGHLIGIIKEFYRRQNITNLRFKPAYNPYTEPSMEIFGYHPMLKRWVEVGNSGIFRPEMLLPMGLPEDVTAIAWGLSLERPTMIQYGINNIRELFGPNIDVQLLRRNPVCWVRNAPQAEEYN